MGPVVMCMWLPVVQYVKERQRARRATGAMAEVIKSIFGEWLDPKPLYETSPYITHDPDRPVRFVQVFQSIPKLEPFYTEFEKNFDVSAAYKAVRDHPLVPIIACFLYMGFLIEGTRASRKLNADNPKKPRQLIPLGPFPAIWNAFLAAFSIIGAARVVPHFLFLFTHKTFQETVCEAPDTVRTSTHTHLSPLRSPLSCLGSCRSLVVALCCGVAGGLW